MKHPDDKYNRNQEKFLADLPPEEREFHARMFRMGNAAYRYHQLARDAEPTEKDFVEWLEGLPEDLRHNMEQKGFEACKTMLPFTRYVNEKRDIGMDEWMEQHLSAEDYAFYKKQSKL